MGMTCSTTLPILPSWIDVFLSLCNATRIVYRHADSARLERWQESGPLSREIVSLPEIYVDKYDVDVIDVMRPAFTTLWNGFGFLTCDRYGDVQKWKASDPYALNW
jgi:hypothetical protein